MVTPKNWQRSSFSGSGDGNNCIELATVSGAVHLLPRKRCSCH
ncbi:hypothetical protein SALBM135S_01717 [Streptomyces alboniger]